MDLSCRGAGLPIQPPSSSSSLSEQASSASGTVLCRLNAGVSPRRHRASLAQHPPPERSRSAETLWWQHLAQLGLGGRGGEEGREREIEALGDIHSKFIGAKLQSAWICFLLEITGNYRHQQLLFK